MAGPSQPPDPPPIVVAVVTVAATGRRPAPGVPAQRSPGRHTAAPAGEFPTVGGGTASGPARSPSSQQTSQIADLPDPLRGSGRTPAADRGSTPGPAGTPPSIGQEPRIPREVHWLAQQTRPVDRVVTVAVAGPSPAGAIAAALRQDGVAPPDDGFVWLLDESTRPAPDALDRLLACAALDPGAAVLGPVGVTVDRAGLRRPAPGPPLAVRDVLAVDRAGALVRSRAWRLLDGPNPLAGRADDLDLCWRAWRAGLRVVTVPAARLLAAGPRATEPERPAEHPGGHPAGLPRAAHRHWDGHLGRTGAERTGRVERVDALRVRIGQSGPLGWPLALAGALLAITWRALAALARGQGRSAGAEALVLAAVLADPARLWRLARRPSASPGLPPGRRSRFSSSRVPARALRGLLPSPTRPGSAMAVDVAAPAPPWPPASARPGTAADGIPAVGRRARPAGHHSAPEAAGSASIRRGPDGSLWPVAVLTGLLVAAGCWLTRADAARAGPLPPGAADLWASLWSGWLGPAGGLLGGPGPAPPWTPLLALLASALGGRPGLAAGALLAAAPALAGLAAYRATGLLGARRWARAGLAACYALAPPVTAAATRGDLAAVGACAATPLVLVAAARLLAPPDLADGDRYGLPGPGGAPGGWKAAWALAGALLLAVACAPGLLPVAAVALAAAGATGTAGKRPDRHAGASGPAGAAAERPRLASRLAAVLAAGCVPLLPTLWVAARTGRDEILTVLVDRPGLGGAEARAAAAFVVACVLAAGLGGILRRPDGGTVWRGVGLCWLVAGLAWAAGQGPLAAAGLLAAVGVAWSTRPGTGAQWPAGPRRVAPAGRRGNGLALVVAVVLMAGPALLFARAAGALGGAPAGGAGWAGWAGEPVGGGLVGAP
ncbi:hypothetical protein I6A94_41020, partial [Frankia sp. CN4]|nr:hypothetical protein [Frankia nepalensis]